MTKPVLTFLFCLILAPSLKSQIHDWAKGFGPRAWVEAVETDHFGNSLTVGIFQDSIDFDPGPGVTMAYPAWGRDPYVVKLDSLGNFLWGATAAGSATGDVMGGLALDDSGYVYMTGTFGGTCDFDPGPGVFNIVAPSNIQQQAYIWKLSPAGNLVWVKAIESNFQMEAEAIEVDASGNVYVGGSFRQTMDFDPGPGVFNLSSSSNNLQPFILMLDSIGDFRRAFTFPGIGEISEIRSDTMGHIYTSGRASSTMDFDPGPGMQSIVINSGTRSFIHKMDTAGNFMWVDTVYAQITAMVLDGYGHVLSTGIYTTLVDFDPGPGSDTFPDPPGTSNGFVWKLDTAGLFKKVLIIDGPGLINCYDIDTDEIGSAFIAGKFYNNLDFDPGLGVHNLVSVGSSDAFISKMDSGGNLIFAATLSGPSQESSASMALDANSRIVFAGTYNSVSDFDPGAGNASIFQIGNISVFTARWKQIPCHNLAIVMDSLQNATCADSSFASGHAINGIQPYAYQWNLLPSATDTFVRSDIGGLYTLSVSDANNCQASSSLIVEAPGIYSGIDLVGYMSLPQLSPVFDSWIGVIAYNDGCVPTNGQVILVLDSVMTFLSATVPPVAVSGDSLFWDLNNITYDSVPFQTWVNVQIDSLAEIGSISCSKLIVPSVPGEVDTLNNNKHYCAEIVGAIDPNDKQVYPVGACSQHYVEKDQLLTYTIRFQNTGTAPAVNVEILDTLNTFLDLSTVRLVAYSHGPVLTTVRPGNELSFRIENIMLPDSASDPQGSNGFLVFQARPLPGLPDETRIENTAGIIFDFNAPVITNTVFNTLIDTVPLQIPAVWSIDSTCQDYFWRGQWYNTSGQYSLILPNGPGICDSVFRLDLTVVTAPDTAVQVTGGQLTAAPGAGSYQWLDCNNGFQPINGATSSVYMPSQSGSYAVQVVQQDCQDTSACFSVVLIGTANPLSSPNTLHPNPNDGNFTISLGQVTSEASIIVRDARGRELAQINAVQQDHVKMDLDLPAGLYFLQVIAGGKNSFIKLMVE